MVKPNKTYRVKLESTVIVEVEVDARNKEEAAAKAECWCCWRSGQHPVREYYWVAEEEDEGGYVNDDTDLYYEVTGEVNHTVSQVEVLKEDEATPESDGVGN